MGTQLVVNATPKTGRDTIAEGVADKEELATMLETLKDAIARVSGA